MTKAEFREVCRKSTVRPLDFEEAWDKLAYLQANLTIVQRAELEHKLKGERSAPLGTVGMATLIMARGIR